MDEQRFDAALRALNQATTRRAGLAGMLAVLVGGPGAARVAAARPGAAGPCGDGSAKENRCTANSDCCTKYCAQGQCRCKPNWMECKKDGHCCSGACVDGRCDGGCKEAGGRCEEQFNCCDGMDCIKGVCSSSKKATCSKQNCPGCCGGTMCRVGNASRACGAKGAVCEACVSPKICQGGKCKSGGGCSAATCPNGCCKDGACHPGSSDSACGKGGVACAACTGNKTCQNGSCKASGGSCSVTNCASGCCDGTTCKAGTSDSDCGTGGSACAACTGGDTCQSQTCAPTCNAGVCPNGCCDGGTCVAGTDATACGTGGAVCSVCAGSATPLCVANACAAGTWANQTTFGSFGAGASNFNGPFGVWVSGDGLTVYVADEENARISYWSRPGVTGSDAVNWSNDATFGSLGSAATQFNTPPGVFVSVDQRTAWIADWYNYRVSIWTRADTTSAWGNPITIGSQGAGASQFEEPKDVFASPDGLTLWVSDTGNSRISIWTRPSADSANWQNQTTFGSSNLSFPNGIFVTDDGLTVFVADHNNSRISVWTRPNASSLDWQNQSTFGTLGTGAADLKLADGVWASQDTLSAWVADTGNSRVSIWTRTSATATAWTHVANFGTYGSSTTADDKLDGPRSVVLSSDAKTAWIGDYGNSRISVWTQT